MAGAGQKVRRDSSATRAPPTQNTPAITCAPGRVKGTDSARGFGCQTRAVIVVDVGGPRFCWLCCGEIYCGGKGVVGDMARRVGDGGEPVGVFHIEVDSKRTLTNQKVRHPKMQEPLKAWATRPSARIVGIKLYSCNFSNRRETHRIYQMPTNKQQQQNHQEY